MATLAATGGTEETGTGTAMIPILLAALLLFPLPPLGATLGTTPPTPQPVASTTALPATGLATYYAPGVFERVLAARGLSPDGCGDCDGFAAMLWPDDLGRVVCVENLRLLVVDIAAAQHRAGLLAKGWIIDIDRASWLRLGWQDTPTLTEVIECG